MAVTFFFLIRQEETTPRNRDEQELRHGRNGRQTRLCCNLGHGGGLGCGPDESISVVLVAHHNTCPHVGLKWMDGGLYESERERS